MREKEAEVDNHLLIHCHIAVSLWNMFLCILGVSCVMSKTTLELLNSRPGVGSRGKNEGWWSSSQHVSGGPYGRKGRLGALKDRRLIFRELK